MGGKILEGRKRIHIFVEQRFLASCLSGRQKFQDIFNRRERPQLVQKWKLEHADDGHGA
jgi:hypothetical protein